MAVKIGFVQNAGTLAHYMMLAEIKALAEANGWTVLRYDDVSFERELILKGVGYSGTEEIFVGFRTYHDIGADYYNLLAGVFTGYVSSNSFDTQPNAYLSGIPGHNNRIDYWLTVNPQRIALGMKVGTPVYESAYVGKILPYAPPTQYPYPVVCAGMLTGAAATRYDDTSHSMPYKGARANMALRFNSGAWLQVDCYPWNNTYLTGATQLRETGDEPLVEYAGTGDGAISAVTVPASAGSEVWTLTCTVAAVDGGTFSVSGSVHGAQADASIGVAYENGVLGFLISDGAADFIVGDVFTITYTAHNYKLLPVTLSDANGLYGELEGIFQITGFNNVVENTIGLGPVPTTGTADAGNTGDGTLTGVAQGVAMKPGTYTLTCTAAAANGGTFSVVDPEVIDIGPATVGVAFSHPQIDLLINDGATDFIVGDIFTIEILPLYVVLQDVARTGFVDYYALKLDH